MKAAALRSFRCLCLFGLLACLMAARLNDPTITPRPKLEKPEVPAAVVAMNSECRVAIQLIGSDLLDEKGVAATTVTVTFGEGTGSALRARILDSPVPTATAITVEVEVPPEAAQKGGVIAVSITTSVASSNVVKYLLEPLDNETAEKAMARITGSLNEKDRATLVDAFHKAREQGYSLSVPNVKDNVSVHAVLLPYPICKALFGTDIADGYTAIEVIISNRSPDAALIIQNIYVDYSHWGLAGMPPDAPLGEVGAYEARNRNGQIASTESRLVRGDLLDNSVWSKRSWFIRSLQAAGTIAASIQFSVQSKNVLKSIGAFNGQFIPGAEALWPDPTLAQANRISDFGFQVNKVVAKESAEVVMAFYPMCRFLTPGLQRIFKKAPALLFTPGAVAFDKEAYAVLQKNAPAVLSDTAEIEALRSYLKWKGTDNGIPADEEVKKGKRVADFLDSFSLNHIRVVVGGTMTVDIASIPPAIQEVVFDDGDSVWASGGTKRATIKGKYLGGAQVAFADASSLGIKDISTLAGSTETALKFQFTLERPIDRGKVLILTANKKTQAEGEDRTLTSSPYLIKVAYDNISITSTSLPSAVVGTKYKDLTLTESGGTPPFKWSVEPKLPSDLSLSETGVITGTPKATSNTKTFTFTVVDGSGKSASKALGLTIQPNVTLPPG